MTLVRLGKGIGRPAPASRPELVRPGLMTVGAGRGFRRRTGDATVWLGAYFDRTMHRPSGHIPRTFRTRTDLGRAPQ